LSIIYYIYSTLSSSIGGLVVKLAVAIQGLKIQDVGQPRVRFPADALSPSPRCGSFHFAHSIGLGFKVRKTLCYSRGIDIDQ
jgi:hypothetical protein